MILGPTPTSWHRPLEHHQLPVATASKNKEANKKKSHDEAQEINEEKRRTKDKEQKLSKGSGNCYLGVVLVKTESHPESTRGTHHSDRSESKGDNSGEALASGTNH